LLDDPSITFFDLFNLNTLTHLLVLSLALLGRTLLEVPCDFPLILDDVHLLLYI
jgi:hypothetical protein